MGQRERTITIIEIKLVLKLPSGFTTNFLIFLRAELLFKEHFNEAGIFHNGFGFIKMGFPNFDGSFRGSDNFYPLI